MSDKKLKLVSIFKEIPLNGEKILYTLRLHYDSGDFEDITVDDIAGILIEVFSAKGDKTLPFEFKKPSDGLLFGSCLISAKIYEDLSENEKVKFVVELKKKLYK